MNGPWEPDWVTPPGEILKEWMELNDISVVSLAKGMDRSLQYAHQLINGVIPITLEDAMLLEKYVGATSEFWNNLESNYQKDLVRLHQTRSTYH